MINCRQLQSIVIRLYGIKLCRKEIFWDFLGIGFTLFKLGVSIFKQSKGS